MTTPYFMTGTIKVFISYSNYDTYYVNQLYESLYSVGCIPYIAEWWLEAGIPLANKIKENIADSTCLVAMLSNEANRSAWVHEEIGYAVSRNLPIIPVIERGVVIRGFLEGLEFIPYDIDNFDETIYRIMTDIRAKVFLNPLVPGLPPLRAIDTLTLTCKACNNPFLNPLPSQEQINMAIKNNHVFLFFCPICYNHTMHHVSPKTFKIIT